MIRFSSAVIFATAVVSSAPAAYASTSGAHSYARVQDFLANLIKKYPQSTKLIEIGQNDQGESIVGVAVGNGPTKNLIVGTHHGNEYGATEVALGAAEDMAKNPIAGQTVFIIPVLNVTGFNADRREETLPGSHANTTDPNRDYPGPCATNGPFHLKSTKALADFIAKQGIVASATLHTFGPLVLYPWGISTHDVKTSYDTQFISLGSAAAAYSHYTVGNSTDALYPADGTFEDYSFWKHGIWSLLFEIGHTHDPDENEIQQLVSDNVPGLRNMMMTAPNVRATDHDFKGQCDARRRRLDRHDE